MQHDSRKILGGLIATVLAVFHLGWRWVAGRAARLR